MLTLLDAPDERFCSFQHIPLDLAAARRQMPNALALSGEGRCSVWWRDTPSLDGKRIGYVGHFAVTQASAARPLLDWACKRLTAEGCTLAVGPLDGTTWQRYRLITERGDEPLFLLEPDNPDDWPDLFRAAGFTPLAHYTSAVNEHLGVQPPRIAQLAQQAHDAGYVFRSLKLDHFDDELRRAHALSLLSFRDNFLYSPISADDFLAQYAGVRRFLRPELVLLVEKQGELVGFLLAIPDLLRAQRGQPVDTVILKTLAVHPAHGGLGLGSLLMARCHETAQRAGFSRAIHALMHETNRSGRISAHTARVFRRYTLFARPLS